MRVRPYATTFLALSTFAIPSTLDGQRVSDSALARCGTITAPLLRLRCYDALAKGSDTGKVSAGAAFPGNKVGNWIVNEQTNPIDDSKTVVLALQAEEGRSRMGQPPTLLLRCQSTKVEAFINWADYMGSDASIVTTRLGNAPPERKRWSHSTDNRATFFPDDDLEFLEALRLVDRFIAQATPYSESPITAVFNLNGLAEAVVPLRTACGLK